MVQPFDKLMQVAISRRLDEEEVKTLFQAIGEKPEIVQDDDLLFYKFNRSGISCLFNEERVLETVHLFGENRDGFLAYSGSLPGGTSFKNSKAEVVQKLGKPSVEGGGEPSLLGGKVPHWIKYLYPQYQFHLQFDDSLQKIVLVTLMSADLKF